MLFRSAYFSEDFDFDLISIEKNLKKFPELRELLPELADRFEAMDDFSHDPIENTVRSFAEEKGAKVGVVMNGARTLLSGVSVGPSMIVVFELIGKERSIMRLRSQVAWNI